MEKGGHLFLINPTIGGSGLEELIEKNRDKIILLLTPYVSHQTVTHPIELGADDYMQKPISVEELIRKIKHLIEHYRLKEELAEAKKFLKHIAAAIDVDLPPPNFPLFVTSSVSLLPEKVAIELADQLKKRLKLVDLRHWREVNWRERGVLFYCYNFEEAPAQKELLKLLSRKEVIVSVKSPIEGVEVVELKSNSFSLDEEILTIDEYVKRMILIHQERYPDTILSKKLGISRKSLWERRKRYGIPRKKKPMGR
jgi:DNA-binding NtrC family response regulator